MQTFILWKLQDHCLDSLFRLKIVSSYLKKKNIHTGNTSEFPPRRKRRILLIKIQNIHFNVAHCGISGGTGSLDALYRSWEIFFIYLHVDIFWNVDRKSQVLFWTGTWMTCSCQVCSYCTRARGGKKTNVWLTGKTKRAAARRNYIKYSQKIPTHDMF